jgi:hypothetical protein
MPRHLLFLTAARTVRHRPAYAAMELISLPWNHEVAGYDAWLYPAESNPGPRAVRVAIARQSISHVSTTQGSMWLCDGEPLRRDQRDSVTWAAAALRHSVFLTPPVEALRLPAFVASDPRLRPCRYEAVVRLHARTLADLPDFEVSANELADLTRIGAAGNEKVRKAAREAWRTEPRVAAEMAPLPAAMHLPVHVEHGTARTHGVLRLDSEQSPGTFRSTLFLSHDDAPLAAGAVLARRAERHWADRSFRSESQVATVQRVGWPLPFAGGGNDPPFGPGANADAGGAALPIVCTECCQRFGPDAFTLRQLEVIEYWGEYAPLVKEHSLLTRTQRMYTRHPDARGQVRTKLDTILHSDDPEIRKKLFDGVPFNEIDPPRPAEYEGRLRAWADGDEELVQFLETHSFNLDRRLQFVREEMERWENRLADRVVVCPECGRGAVALEIKSALG